jgi:glutamate-1-semialdehyde 2,1-aminomutase
LTDSVTRSSLLYEEACTLMPGGVNSPVRAFRAVGGTPLFFDHAHGARLVDVDGKSYIDYVSSWGAIILGHAHHAITHAVTEAAAKGTSFGAPHAGEVRLANLVLDRVPGVDMIRFVNSGTEATSSAIRLARAATKRSKILKFEGNYHGAADSLLAKAGSGVATFGLPDTEGVPAGVVADTLVARYNDAGHVEEILNANLGEVAAVLVEPISGNMGCVPPVGTFLHDLRRLCTEHGTLFIIDEVMTGFRVARGGATVLYDLHPDIVCLGKVIGGGLPVGAYAARRELMNLIAPVGPVYQAGTLSGNPLAMAAGAAALEHLGASVYENLELLGWQLQDGLQRACSEAGISAQVQRIGSMISVFFTDQPVKDFTDAQKTNKELFGKLFHALLERGVYLPPSALEAWFLTAAHTEEDIERTVFAFGDSLKEIRA